MVSAYRLGSAQLSGEGRGGRVHQGGKGRGVKLGRGMSPIRCKGGRRHLGFKKIFPIGRTR